MNKSSVAQQAKTASFFPLAQGLIQRKCACGNHTVAGGACTECAKKTNGLQRKLAIGASNDPLEREADQVADQAMTTSAHSTLGNTPVRIQRYAGQTAGDADMAPSSVDHVLASTGRPLEPAFRQDMEQRLGYDFSQVRVHSDAAAEQSARDVHAHAYTVGHDVVFGAGRFTPGTRDGQRLIAHELTHVIQQQGAEGVSAGQSDGKRSLSSDSTGIPNVIQRKVVDDNNHLPCRAVAGRNAAYLTARENEAAALADSAAAAVRANPLAEPTRALVWKRFRLDYNDSLTRCRFLPEIGDRFAKIAREIRGTDCTYQCTATGEPSSECSTALGVTHIGMFGGQKIDLCSRFWAVAPDQQAITLLHEWAHYVFSTRGLNDELPGGFDTAECYNAFASEFAGQPITGPEDTNCVPNTRVLPALDQGRLHVGCSNVFLNLSAVGGYAYGLPGSHHYGTGGAGLDFLFPLTRMHDWELGVGARYLRFAPIDSNNRDAYLLGVRAALAFRYRPWRFGSQIGAYVEGGGVNVPVGTTGDKRHPYGAAGISGGVNFHIGRQTALQILGEVGGGIGFDTQNNQRFEWFQSGLSVVLQFQ
ncbi:eCIS core domain-containing protein [Sulfurirhabdus autotrophica]|uniref:Uncharacterized protein DUF4157 n=1 Tax=Sulfurirhabdus autotrophica TaxID=1706046 RepID=A0A4R3Y597_9PROT|nr:DUF4157 domain-containing protein [Sulfurirhabdus autotrophica]TCV86752.1 uncharacterized protein DUF4157 [Sulfurirhabdus autotrophica]